VWVVVRYPQFAYTVIVREAMDTLPITVVETERFLKDTASLMPPAVRAEMVWFLALNPDAGNIIPETGGVRKLRWALPGRGKRGGARVIYYFHNESVPVFLLAAYGKNEKANLSQAERSAMKRLVPLLVASYGAKG
jgi:mRNA-degrading endonuclease RelE of RelBE toxin-antitoxin system